MGVGLGVFDIVGVGEWVGIGVAVGFVVIVGVELGVLVGCVTHLTEIGVENWEYNVGSVQFWQVL